MSVDSLSQAQGRAVSIKRGRVLEYLTIRWNVLEAIVAIGACLLAGSIAYVSFAQIYMNKRDKLYSLF